MKEEKQYTQTVLYGIIAVGLVFILIAFLGGIVLGREYGNPKTTAPEPVMFYDGEGNHIPNEAVQVLVRCQFVWITKEEDKLLHKYFYGTECKHKILP